MTLTTTLELLKTANACTEGFRKLKTFLGNDYPADKPINILTILESNGFDHAIWALRAVQEPDAWKTIAELAADFAEDVLPIFEKQYPADKRPRQAVQAVRDFVAGRITRAQLNDAAAAARYAAAAADAAADAARYAAYAAAADAAADAARYAAYAAAARYAADAYADATDATDARKKQIELLQKRLAYMTIQEMLGAFLSTHNHHNAAAEAYESTERLVWLRLAELAIRTAPESNRTNVAQQIKLALDDPANGGPGEATDFEIRVEEHPMQPGQKIYRVYRWAKQCWNDVGLCGPESETLYRRIVGLYPVRTVTLKGESTWQPTTS